MTHPKLDHNTALVLLARAGYAARALVYLLVGGLATLAVLGQGGDTTGSRGALRSVLSAPLGDVLLAIITAGLIAYAIWRSFQALTDADRHGKTPKGLAIRSGLLASAVSHLLLAGFAISLIMAFGQSGDSNGGSQDAASWLMSQPYGRWLAAIVGLVFVVIGGAHAFKGWTVQFEDYFDMPSTIRCWAFPVCRIGLVVRGVVFVVVGGLFMTAAYHIDSSQAGGTAEALNTLREQPFGPWLLGIVAVGLMAFGVYSLLESLYRQVHPSR
ncbi:DUF1206 domain-containing protein [Marinimicrobium sp. ARAG 43.8]|uniref:DUF1206 domain-containing protein n=1 Tax=Marinimicrobium sp. ARAG 43.8 TaxID=3418719 RepID=UPI003CF2558E